MNVQFTSAGEPVAMNNLFGSNKNYIFILIKHILLHIWSRQFAGFSEESLLLKLCVKFGVVYVGGLHMVFVYSEEVFGYHISGSGFINVLGELLLTMIIYIFI